MPKYDPVMVTNEQGLARLYVVNDAIQYVLFVVTNEQELLRFKLFY